MEGWLCGEPPLSTPVDQPSRVWLAARLTLPKGNTSLVACRQVPCWRRPLHGV